MRFNYHTTVLVGLFGTAISLDVTFSPVARPTRGETIRAGSVYTVEWNEPKGISGPIKISLHNNELEDSASSDDHVQLQTISAKTESSSGKFNWNVNSTLPAGDKYYIQIDYLNEYEAILSESSEFKIEASNGSTHATSSSTTLMTTGSSTISSGSGATATPASSGAGSATTHISPAPFAFVGAALVGMLAL